MKRLPKPKVLPPLDIRGPVGEPLRCLKKCFSTEREARLEGHRQRPYFCVLCDAWHLTHYLTRKKKVEQRF